MESNRQKKVATIFMEELAEAFRKEASENFSGTLISVTEVKVTPDLTIAKVYISIFPTNKKNEILEAIKAKTNVFKSILASGAAKTMRITPDLLFYLDITLDEIDKIDRALRGEGNNPTL